MSSGFLQIEKLDDSNFNSWKIHMRSVLIHSEFWSYVNGTCKKPKEGEDAIKAWETKDEKALATIYLYMKPSLLIHVKNCKTSKEAWDVLEDLFQPCGPARKVTLFRKLLQVKMAEGQSISDHLKEFFNVVENLNEIGISLEKDDSELLTIILLSSLPRSYENFVIAIESRDELPDLKTLKTKLIEEGQRRGTGDVYEISEQLYSSSSGGKHVQEKSQHNHKPRTTKAVVTCYYCKRKGHIKAECRQRQEHLKRKHGTETNSMLAMQFSMVRCSNSAMAANIDKTSWVIDSGSTSHMCSSRDMFSSLKMYREKVHLANYNHVYCVGIGSVKIQVSGHLITLNDVLYVPELNRNFISVMKIVEKGYKVVFYDKSVTIESNNESILIAEKVNNLFVYREKKEKLYSNISRGESEILKWHSRYGHLNVKNLVKLKKNNMVRGLNLKVSEEINVDCDTCAKGKIHVSSFKVNTEIHTKDILELVHTDICGPMRKTSNGGAKYFVLFIDDFSRMNFVYFLKSKDEIFEKFKLFKREVENQTKKNIKILRSDNGREYLSKEFTKYLEENGIIHQLTVPYTPQQNGVAERANRTVVEMARCMLIEAKLPESYWGEAINTAVYIRNRCPTKLLGDVTPYERWTRVKPCVAHLRPFGCKAIILNKHPNVTKFQPKGMECVLTGYCQDSKAYRLVNIKTGKLHKSRDVIFIENMNKFSEDGQDYAIVNFPGESRDERDELMKTCEIIPNVVKNEEKSDIFENENDVESTIEENKPIFENPKIENVSNEVYTNEGNDIAATAVSNEETKGITPNKGGRPRLIKTGKKGRPKKVYNQFLDTSTIINSKQPPVTVKEALEGEEAKEWLKSMEDEYQSLIKNDTWELIDLPAGRKPIKSKWVFSIKRDKDGNIVRYKSRLVAKGCSQTYGLDYKETFAPVTRYSTIRLLLAVAVELGLLVHQIDVVAAYLNSNLAEEVYMEQPEQFVDETNPRKVCKLKKALYGLKQSGRAWNQKLDKALLEIGFQRCQTDNCAYTMNKKGEFNIIAVFVDDIIIACTKESSLVRIKQHIKERFDIIDRGEINLFLGMEIERDGDRGSIKITQKHLIQEILEKINMGNCRTASTPLDPGIKLRKRSETTSPDKIVDKGSYQSMIGSLMYLSIVSRPEIMHSVVKLAQFNQEPTSDHLSAVKHIVRYLKHTINFSLTFSKTGKSLVGYADADWAGDLSDRKSYSGFTFILGGASISWSSTKQTCVALSSTEAEYIAISSAAKEVTYLRELMRELGLDIFIRKSTDVYNDNLSAQQLVKNPVFHSRTKHIEIRMHHVREVYQRGIVDVKYLPSDSMVADVLTKNLTKFKHFKFRQMLGVK